jgi:hypothetical protein
VIEIPKHQITHVEYILEQSAKGNHVLFPGEKVLLAFKDKVSISESEAYSIEPLIEKLLSFETLKEQQVFFESMNERLQIRLIQTYFNIVENNLVENEVLKH